MSARWLLALLLAAAPFLAAAQAPDKDKEKAAAEDKAEKPPATPPKPRIRLKPKGGTGSNIGDDVPGGGGTTAEPSRGGTPGTPSGSFTGPSTKP
jgi:hypothetical protein